MSRQSDAARPFRAVEQAIRRRRLLDPEQRVVVAVSGGADSVFLLLALHTLAPRLGLSLSVAHLDHGWRAAAVDDARFVEALAGRLAAPYFGARRDARDLARAGRLSPEDAARRLRYAFLRDVCRRTGSSVIATGHNQDDQLETVILAWLRGSGPAGLAAMSWTAPLPAADAAGLCVVRPLLGIPREQIRANLRTLGQDWREDPSNADPALLRNGVRLELVPLLESLAPGFRSALLRSAELSRQADAFLRRTAHLAAAGLFVPGEGALRAPRRSFLALDPALRSEVLRWAIAELQGDTRGLEWAHLRGALETIERGRGGAVAWLSPCLHLRLERSQIVIEQRHPGAMPDNEVARPEPCNP